jgi:hypothetical protein
MAIDKRIRIAALCAVIMFASGCKALSGKACNEPKAYTQTVELDPLAVPAGMKGLDTRRAVRVPDLKEPVAPRGPDDGCLEEPPKYSNADLKAPTHIVPAPPPSGKDSKPKAAPPPADRTPPPR